MWRWYWLIGVVLLCGCEPQGRTYQQQVELHEYELRSINNSLYKMNAQDLGARVTALENRVSELCPEPLPLPEDGPEPTPR